MMKNFAYLIFLILSSCTSIQQAVIQDKQVIIRVQHVSYTYSPQFYSCEVKRNGGEREFHVTNDSTTTVYLLPSNKLTLLYEMEMGLKDIKATRFSEYKVIIQADKAKRSYRVNTDLIANFITGLKKK
jgi:hypothetical protein